MTALVLLDVILHWSGSTNIISYLFVIDHKKTVSHKYKDVSFFISVQRAKLPTKFKY